MSLFNKKAVDAPVRVPFYKRLTAEKPQPDSIDKKFYQITCIAGAGIALVSMILSLIFFRGLGAIYTWPTLALGLGSLLFYAAAYLRYELPNLDILQRIADAAMYLTVFSALAPLQLILMRKDLYDVSGAPICAWVSFGLVAAASLFFLVSSLITKKKFRILGSFFYLLMPFSLIFGASYLCNAFAFAPWLAILLMVIAIAAFSASPVFFWLFDRYSWQMKVVYILTAVGTFACSLMTVLYSICGI